MGDLEDAFLKQNVPGRYSSWTEENDDNTKHQQNSNDKSDDSEDDEYYFEGLSPPPTSNSTTSTTQPAVGGSIQSQIRTSGNNTGVKGVLADYHEARQHELLAKEEERLDNLKALYKATHPAVRQSECISSNNNAKKTDHDSSRGDSDVDVDDDDDFLQQFRNQRIAELKQQQQQISAKAASSLSSTLHQSASLTTVTPEEYVKLVDSINPNIYLIVHLYDPNIQQCNMLHSTLDKLATSSYSYSSTAAASVAAGGGPQFIEVNALEANPNLDTIILPAIQIYRGGELLHNLVRFTDELPRNFGMEDVREILRTLGVLV